MATAKVFKSGNSLALRLPKQFRLQGPEVEIFRRGKDLVVREKTHGLARAFELLATLPQDMFEDERSDAPPQKRAGL